MRSHVATTYGVLLPEIRLTDDAGLPPGTYRVKVQGVEQARDSLRPDRVLALLSAPGDGDAARRRGRARAGLRRARPLDRPGRAGGCRRCPA